jgi:amino acid adenylation domain-containing protein
VRVLHAGFTASARRFPDRPALLVDGQLISYAELDRLSGAVAARLAGTGPPRPRVGLPAARSVTAYAAYLGILRCGGTVVPLDAGYPESRLGLIAELARLDCVIAERDQPAGFAAGRPILRYGRTFLQEGLDVPATEGPPVPDHEGSPEDLAYILFTSGSTGRPKGVPIRHRHLDHLVRHCSSLYQVGPDSRVSQTFRLTFDPSVLDLFMAWGAGAALVVPGDDDLFDPVGFVNRHGVTHWSSVPSLITLADDDGMLTPGAMPSLRSSVFCGEQLTLTQAAAWATAAPGSSLDNAYGPTELAVLVTSYRLPGERSRWPRTGNGTVPIGAPFPHLQTRIADGELLVRGSQRFDGYLDPADDDGRFLPAVGTAGPQGHPPGAADPRPAEPGGWPPDAWYRTGDRVENVGDGVLVHLGRLDHQVKVLGQRVEPAEVEAALRTGTGVRDAVVVQLDGRSRRAGDLAAVVTGAPLTGRDLRARLLELLPRHMVPKHYLHLDALPVDDRGKVDRRACARLLEDEPRPRPGG